MKQKDDLCILFVQLHSMKLPDSIKPTPWDSLILGINTYEIHTLNSESMEAVKSTPGHYTIRLDPLVSKKIIADNGFYYCDTLIEPYCNQESFIPYHDPSVSVCLENNFDKLLSICHGAFSYGRFHRDHNLSNKLADIRYDNWLMQLYILGKVYGVYYNDQLAAFIAVDDNKMVLHAVSKPMQGLGLAKYFWTPVCRLLYDAGYFEIASSISASNLAVLNLYASLGFRFRNSVDIYHFYTR